VFGGSFLGDKEPCFLHLHFHAKNQSGAKIALVASLIEIKVDSP
jgi:hypothetical protein